MTVARWCGATPAFGARWIESWRSAPAIHQAPPWSPLRSAGCSLQTWRWLHRHTFSIHTWFIRFIFCRFTVIQSYWLEFDLMKREAFLLSCVNAFVTSQLCFVLLPFLRFSRFECIGVTLTSLIFFCSLFLNKIVPSSLKNAVTPSYFSCQMTTDIAVCRKVLSHDAVEQWGFDDSIFISFSISNQIVRVWVLAKVLS